MFGKGYGISMFFYDISHAIVLLGGNFPPPRKYRVDGTPFKNDIKGGMLIVGNHVSFKDPWFYSATFSNRRMFFIASELVMKGKIRNFLCYHSGCIKIDRTTTDIKAVRKVTSVLKNGRAVVMFPEGTLHPDEDSDLSDIKAGVIFFASQAGVPIVPAYSLKPKHWYNRRTIVVGEPFLVSDRVKRKFLTPAETDAMAKELLMKINELRKVYEKIEGER